MPPATSATGRSDWSEHLFLAAVDDAVTLAAEGLPLVAEQRWFASYTRVSNLAYNNKNPAEKYEVFGVGLGRGCSD